MKNVIRYLCIILALAGGFLVFGSVGAMDTGDISEFQCILQSFLGFSLLIPYGVRKVYLKYHNTI